MNQKFKTSVEGNFIIGDLGVAVNMLDICAIEVVQPVTYLYDESNTEHTLDVCVYTFNTPHELFCVDVHGKTSEEMKEMTMEIVMSLTKIVEDCKKNNGLVKIKEIAYESRQGRGAIQYQSRR